MWGKIFGDGTAHKYTVVVGGGGDIIDKIEVSCDNYAEFRKARTILANSSVTDKYIMLNKRITLMSESCKDYPKQAPIDVQHAQSNIENLGKVRGNLKAINNKIAQYEIDNGYSRINWNLIGVAGIIIGALIIGVAKRALGIPLLLAGVCSVYYGCFKAQTEEQKKLNAIITASEKGYNKVGAQIINEVTSAVNLDVQSDSYKPYITHLGKLNEFYNKYCEDTVAQVSRAS